MTSRRRIYYLIALAVIFSLGLGLDTYYLLALTSQVPPPQTVTSPRRKPINGGNVQEGKLVHKVSPEYPSLVREMKPAIVRLSLTIDEEGKVTKAGTTGGYPICNDAATKAVKKWRYTPTLLNDKPVGVLINVSLPCGEPNGKLDPAIAELLYRVRKGTAADASEKNFVQHGLAMLEITIAGSPEIEIERLNSVGFKIIEKSGDTVLVGSIAVGKIGRLRSVPDILLIAPHRR